MVVDHLYSIGVAVLEAKDEAAAAREFDSMNTLAILCWQLWDFVLMRCLNRTPHLPLTSFPQSIETSQQQHEGPIKIRCVGEVPILFLGQAVIQVGYPVGLESAPTLPRWPWSGQWSDETERRSYVMCAATETSNEEERLARRESLLQREVSPEEAPEGLRGSSEGDLATRSGDAHDLGGGAAVSGGAGAVAVGGGRGVDMGRFRTGNCASERSGVCCGSACIAPRGCCGRK